MLRQARLMSQALRKLTATLNRSNTLLIFINQIRQKVPSHTTHRCHIYNTRLSLRHMDKYRERSPRLTGGGRTRAGTS